MTIQDLSNVWHYSKAKGDDLLVLLAFSDGGDGGPSLEEAARKSRLTVSEVQRSLERLADLGEIEVHPWGTRILVVEP